MDINSIGASQAQQGGYTPSAVAGKEAVQQKPVKSAEIAAKAAAKSQEADDRDVKEAISKIEKFIAPATRDITFTVDNDTGINLIKIIDRSSNQVIRQIPSEEVLNIARALDNLQGLLVREKI
jgi:flagellar protein FlaG